MNINDIEIKSRYFDPDADSYLFFGKNKDEKTLRKFVVGWHSRHSATVLKRKSYLDEATARAALHDILKQQDTPCHRKFYKDHQKQSVYDWETMFLEPHTFNINRKAAEDLINQVCSDYMVDPPQLLWAKQKKGKTPHSEYDPEEHRIRFEHRDHLTMLHEIAHAIHYSYEEFGAAHNPRFVWTAIELYNRYGGFNLSYLVSTACKSGIIGDLDADDRMKPGGFLGLTRPEPSRP